MRVLIVLSVLGCAFAAPFLQDTPEVVAERARFTQLWNAQAAAAAAAPDTHAGVSHRSSVPSHHHQPAATFHTTHNTGKWTGPVAATVPAGLPGSVSQVQDTGDVSAARNAFLAAYRAQVAATTGQQVAAPSHTHNFRPAATHFNAIPAAPQKWTGPVAATVPAGVNGQITPVSDTAEVSAARNAFLASYNAAVAATRPAQHSVHQHHSFQAAPVQPVQPRWTGPVAATIPAGLPGSTSQVSQTADVAAATAAFQNAYSAAVAATTGRRF